MNVSRKYTKKQQPHSASSNQKGIGLIELLIVLAIVAVVVSVVVINGNKASSGSLHSAALSEILNMAGACRKSRVQNAGSTSQCTLAILSQSTEQVPSSGTASNVYGKDQSIVSSSSGQDFTITYVSKNAQTCNALRLDLPDQSSIVTAGACTANSLSVTYD